MNVRYTADQIRYQRMNTKELRESFLAEDLFAAGEISMLYTDNDRAIVGSAIPTQKELRLEAGKELASDYFAERREIGLLNIGAEGSITVDGISFDLVNRDCLYIGRGSREIQFRSKDPANPAVFYLLSYPAHMEYTTSKMVQAEANVIQIGTLEGASKRTIYQYIHQTGLQSCQLVMGFTELEEGSVWNTMPPHTHERRTEIYTYFDLDGDQAAFHFMGTPENTRHLIVRNHQAVISPSWSIHAAAGTSNYAFIWGMGGENQAFDDMDGIAMGRLK